MAQIMALIPPIISSSDGTVPEVGHIPFSTYNGDVPMSEWIIPAANFNPVHILATNLNIPSV